MNVNHFAVHFTLHSSRLITNNWEFSIDNHYVSLTHTACTVPFRTPVYINHVKKNALKFAPTKICDENGKPSIYSATPSVTLRLWKARPIVPTGRETLRVVEFYQREERQNCKKLNMHIIPLLAFFLAEISLHLESRSETPFPLLVLVLRF